MAARELPAARDAARGFLDSLRPGDQAMVVAVGSTVEVVAPLSTDRQAQRDAVARLQPWGTTGLHDAIIQSIDAIQSARGAARASAPLGRHRQVQPGLRC